VNASCLGTSAGVKRDAMTRAKRPLCQVDIQSPAD
jgi:hypothetical protein